MWQHIIDNKSRGVMASNVANRHGVAIAGISVMWQCENVEGNQRSDLLSEEASW